MRPSGPGRSDLNGLSRRTIEGGDEHAFADLVRNGQCLGAWQWDDGRRDRRHDDPADMALQIGAARMPAAISVGLGVVMMCIDVRGDAAIMRRDDLVDVRRVLAFARVEDTAAERDEDEQKRHGPDQEPPTPRMSQRPSHCHPLF